MQFSDKASLTLRADRLRQAQALPQFVAGIRIPRSELARKAMRSVARVTPSWLMNHLFRSFVFAELIGRNRGQRLDSELLFIATMMHTLGLTKRSDGRERFELHSAGATRRFLEKNGVADFRCKQAWRAVLLHTANGIESCLENGAGLVRVGVLADIDGRKLDEIPPDQIQEIFDVWPVLGFRDAFPRLLQAAEARLIAGRSRSNSAGVGMEFVPTLSNALVQSRQGAWN